LSGDWTKHISQEQRQKMESDMEAEQAKWRASKLLLELVLDGIAEIYDNQDVEAQTQMHGQTNLNSRRPD